MTQALAAATGAPRARPRPGWVGYAMVLLGAACFIVNAGVSKVVLTAGVEPARLTAIRCTGAAAGLLVVMVLTRRPGWRVSRREALWLLGYGGVGVALLQWTYFVAIDRLPVGIALLLEYTAPVLISLWARLVRHEPVRTTVWLALALSLAGIALVARVWDGAYLDLVGIVAGLSAAGCFSAYFLLGEHLVAHRDPVSLSFWGFTVGAVCWAVAQPWRSLDVSPLGASTSLLGALSGLTAPVWLLLVWVVILGTLLPFAVETAALQHLPATVVGNVAMVEPVGVTLLGWAWLRESLSAAQLVGAGVVLAGIVIGQAARRPRTA